MKFTISHLLTLQRLHTKFGKDWPYIVLQKKISTYDNDNGCQPIAIGHLSESGDLINLIHFVLLTRVPFQFTPLCPFSRSTTRKFYDNFRLMISVHTLGKNTNACYAVKIYKNERQTKFKWGRGCWVVGVLVGPGSAFVIFSFQSIYI